MIPSYGTRSSPLAGQPDERGAKIDGQDRQDRLSRVRALSVGGSNRAGRDETFRDHATPRGVWRMTGSVPVRKATDLGLELRTKARTPRVPHLTRLRSRIM